MRIWKVSPSELSNRRLLGEHREVHSIVTVLQKMRRGEPGGYQRHPEVLFYADRLDALIRRHEQLTAEMNRRGFRHRSPLYVCPPPEDRGLFTFTPEAIARDRQELHKREGGFRGRRRDDNWRGF